MLGGTLFCSGYKVGLFDVMNALQQATPVTVVQVDGAPTTPTAV